MQRSSSAKPGCKGDPRMNKAVQARLGNPDMPLYHALRIGGFNFPANEDASTLDNDKVTLGQRKNQLLRRLRQLTRKHEKEESEKAQLQIALAGSTGGAIGSLYQQLIQQQQGPPIPSAQQPPTHLNTVQFQRPNTSNSQQGLRSAGIQATAGVKREAPPILDTALADNGDKQATLGMGATLPKHQMDSFHSSRTQNQIQQVLSQQGTHTPPQLSSYIMGNQIMLPTEMRTLFQQSPDVHPLPMQEGLVETQKIHDYLHRQTQGLLGAVVFPPAPNAGVPQKSADPTTPFEQQQHHQEQQQSSAKNAHLPPAAQPPQESAANSSEELDARETVALGVFQQELQTLYCRSMLTAGYSPEETTQRSAYFRRFAFQAWKQECQRLQHILEDVEVESFAPSPAPGGDGQPPQDPCPN